MRGVRVPLALSTLAVAPVVMARVIVVCTYPDLADLVRQVGGPRVVAYSLAKGYEDPHRVEPRPSHVVLLRRAHMVVRVGMDLDLWLNSLIQAAGNPRIKWGAKGYVDVSKGVRKLEVPKRKVTPRAGHWHVYGNPHFLLGPSNIRQVLANILAGLARVDPKGRSYYLKRANSYLRLLSKKFSGWKRLLAPYRGTKFISYHKYWAYFCKDFGLVEFGNIEPKPCIPPSPAHIRNLIKRAKAARVRLVVHENIYPSKFPRLVARAIGARMVTVPIMVGGEKGVDTYIKLIDTIVRRIARALGGRG